MVTDCLSQSSSLGVITENTFLDVNARKDVCQINKPEVPPHSANQNVLLKGHPLNIHQHGKTLQCFPKCVERPSISTRPKPSVFDFPLFTNALCSRT